MFRQIVCNSVNAFVDMGGVWYVGMSSWIASALRNTLLFTFTSTPLTAQLIFPAIDRPSFTSSLPMSIEEGGGAQVVEWQITNETRLCLEERQ